MQWWSVALAFPAGLMLGVFFFGGLWWTVKKLTTTRSAALLFLGSFIVRTAVVVIGLYVLLMAGFAHMIVALVGFLVARMWCVSTFKLPKSKS